MWSKGRRGGGQGRLSAMGGLVGTPGSSWARVGSMGWGGAGGENLGGKINLQKGFGRVTDR